MIAAYKYNLIQVLRYFLSYFNISFGIFADKAEYLQGLFKSNEEAIVPMTTKVDCCYISAYCMIRRSINIEGQDSNQERFEYMDKNDIERYLKMLGQELASHKCKGAILLVGGAVMVLTIGNRHSTRDIDASFEREAAAIRSAVSQLPIKRDFLLIGLMMELKAFSIRHRPSLYGRVILASIFTFPH
jgi:hypothetical protein